MIIVFARSQNFRSETKLYNLDLVDSYIIGDQTYNAEMA